MLSEFVSERERKRLKCFIFRMMPSVFRYFTKGGILILWFYMMNKEF